MMILIIFQLNGIDASIQLREKTNLNVFILKNYQFFA